MTTDPPQTAEVTASAPGGERMSVTVLDGKTVGDGRPGPVTTRLRDAYWAAHEDPGRRTEVSYAG